MNFLLQQTLSALLLYKYFALFVITFLAALALPLPSAPSLMAAAAFAGQGYFSLPGVFIAASLGNILGDNVCYWLARRYGQPILYKIGFRKVLASETFGWVEHEINHYRAPVVFFSRFNVLTTISVNIVSGLSGLSYPAFLIYGISGEITQVLIYGSFGYMFGSNWPTISNLFGKFSLVLVLIIALILSLLSKKLQTELVKRRSLYIRKNGSKH